MSPQLEKLFDAIHKNDSNLVDLILKNDPDLINATDIDGWSAIHICSTTNNSEMLSKLIDDYKADINAITEYGNTPLHIAAEKRQFKIILQLIKQDANLTQVNRPQVHFLDNIPDFSNRLFDYDRNWFDKSTILKRMAILMTDETFRITNNITYELAKCIYTEAINYLKILKEDTDLITDNFAID